MVCSERRNKGFKTEKATKVSFIYISIQFHEILTYSPYLGTLPGSHMHSITSLDKHMDMHAGQDLLSLPETFLLWMFV
jgi:hypothetical protein